jgi:fructosamine-3-kinase
MDFVESGSTGSVDPEVHAADLLAALHWITAPSYGLDFDTLIGGLPQVNTRTHSWLDFFREKRLEAMAEQAFVAGRLPSRTRTRLHHLGENLTRWLEEPEAPSLLHGDVWSGNVLTGSEGVVAFLDPAIYYGHPEIELAFITMFSTFGDRFFRRYQEHHRISPGFWETRRDLYNIYPLLVHVRLFGGGYLSEVERTLERFGF